MTILSGRELDPFDQTYAHVTADIESEAAKLAPPESTWLLKLVVAFQDERKLWNSRPELVAYRIRWAGFRSRLLRLVAGAYLHIAYDLPRALADDWPGQPPWQSGPAKLNGQTIYFRIGAIFPANLFRAAGDRRIVGLSGIVFSRVPKKMLGSSAIWVDDLRKGAWLHAEILAFAADRDRREAAMAEAMTAALEDASGFYPWSILRLLPPDDAVYASGWATILSSIALWSDWLFRYASIAILASWATGRLYDTRLRLAASGDFINLWGLLTRDYVASAVREPEGFAAYRQRRRSDLGIGVVPETGQARA